jgi:hypothetical protein
MEHRGLGFRVLCRAGIAVFRFPVEFGQHVCDRYDASIHASSGGAFLEFSEEIGIPEFAAVLPSVIALFVVASAFAQDDHPVALRLDDYVFEAAFVTDFLAGSEFEGHGRTRGLSRQKDGEARAIWVDRG